MLLIYIIFQIALVLLKTGTGKSSLVLFYIAAAIFLLLLSFLQIINRSGSMNLLRAGILLAILYLFYRTIDMEQSIFGMMPKDETISRLEFNLLGFHPSFVMQSLMEIWLNELSYIAYALGSTLPAVAILVLRKNERREQLESYLTAVSIACCLCFAIMSLFPVGGPREGLAGIYYLDFFGRGFSEFVPIIIDKISIERGSFPAVYFCLVTISALYLWDYGRIYLFISFALMTAVFWGGVYLRYHYLADGILALLIAFLSIVAEEIIKTSRGMTLR